MKLPEGNATDEDHLIYVENSPIVTGEDVEKACLDFNSDKQMRVQIELTEAGGKKMASVTESNLNERIAFVRDGKLYSAPFVRSKISDKLAIEGTRKDLAALVRQLIE